MTNDAAPEGARWQCMRSKLERIETGARRLEPQETELTSTASGYAGFTAAYLAYRTAIYNYMRRMVGDDADAEDLTVTVFEKALRAWNRRPPEHGLRPWLFRIATNACLDELRRRQRIQWQPWSAFAKLFHPRQVAPDNTEAEVLRHEQGALVRAALARLSPRDRAALMMRECHGLAVDEIARALGISSTAAKVALFRARERLRTSYLQLGGRLPKSAPPSDTPLDEAGYAGFAQLGRGAAE